MCKARHQDGTSLTIPGNAATTLLMKQHPLKKQSTAPAPFIALTIDKTINETNCPTKYALELLAGKWNSVILYYLKGGPVHFGELRRLIPTASQKVLTQQLRALEKADIVERKVLDGSVKYVEYSYSDFGLTLAPILAALAEWGEKHRNGRCLPQTVDVSTSRDVVA